MFIMNTKYNKVVSVMAVILFTLFIYWGYENLVKNPQNVNDNNVRYGVGGGPGLTDYSFSPTKQPAKSQIGIGGGPAKTPRVSPSQTPSPVPCDNIQIMPEQ